MRTKKLPPAEKRCQDRGGGKQCRAARLHDSTYCFFHDPVARRGSMALLRVEELALGKPSDIHQLLVEIVERVRKKRLSPQQGYALGWLIQLMMQNLEGIEREARGYHHESYGRIIAGTIHEHLFGPKKKAASEEEQAEEEEAEEAEGNAVEVGEDGASQNGE